MSQWYFNQQGEQRGPVGLEEIRSMLASGELGPDSLVWSPPMADWKSAGHVPELEASPYAPPVSSVAEGIDWSGYEPSGSQIRPWVRYWARTFDFLLFCVLIGSVIAIVFPELLEMNDTLLGIMMLFAYCFVEPVLLCTIGTTPFKGLLRVRLRNDDGSKLNYGRAFGRTFSVWLKGQALGLGFLTIITSIVAYRRLTQDGITSWDRDGGFTVSHQEIGWWRWFILVGVLVGFVALLTMEE